MADEPLSTAVVLSPTDMVEGTDVTLRMLQHWVASDAVWPATVHRSPARRYNQWTGADGTGSSWWPKSSKTSPSWGW